MKLTVYIDILIVVNIIINYFLIRITAMFSNIPCNTRRTIISSVAGAFFSLFIFMDNMILPLSYLIKIISAVLCCLIAFGYTTILPFIRNILCLLRSDTIFSGVLILLFNNPEYLYGNNLYWYININPILLVLCIFAVFIIVSTYDFFSAGISKNSIFSFEIYFGNNHKKLYGFYDTGFGVKDILGRKGVILCSLADLQDTIDTGLYRNIEDFINDKPVTDKRITPIFYSDISSNGMLPAVKPQKINSINNGVKKELKDVLLAFTDKKFSDEVQLIFGKEIFNMIGEHL